MPFKLHSSCAPSSQLISHYILFLHTYLGGEFFMSAKISFQEMRPQKPSLLFKVLHSNANEPSKYCHIARGVHCSQRLLCFSSILSTSALYISNPCPVSLRSLVSRVPELRARPPESWAGDTSPCCPRAYTRKVGKKPTTYSFNQSSLNFHSWKCAAVKKGDRADNNVLQKDCRAHFGEGVDQDVEIDNASK